MKSSISTGILDHVANIKVLLILQKDPPLNDSFSKLPRKNSCDPCNNNKTMTSVSEKASIQLGWRCCFISTWSQLVRWRSTSAQGNPDSRRAANFLVPPHTHGVQPSYSNARLSRFVASHITQSTWKKMPVLVLEKLTVLNYDKKLYLQFFCHFNLPRNK